MAIRIGILIGCALLLAGCGGESTWSNLREIGRQVISSSSREIPHTREQINGIPYASLAAQYGSNVPSLMILGYIDGRKTQWVASNNASLVLENYRIIKTVGFDSDIGRVYVGGEDPLANPISILTTEVEYVLYLEGQYPSSVAETFDCVLRPIKEEIVTILDYDYATIQLEEACESRRGWKITNRYWAQKEDGYIWKSEQHLFENEPSITIYVLKPVIY